MLTKKFLQDLQFEAEDIPYILKNDRLYGEEIEKLAAVYMADKGKRNRKPYSQAEFQQRRSQMLESLDAADKACGDSDNEYIANLLFWLHCVPYAKPLYERANIAMDIYWESMSDLACKTRENKQKRGKCGTAVTWNWYSLFLDLLLFSLGRLQFYIETFEEDCYRFEDFTLKKGDTVYSCHIPSTGKLTPELCMDSFQRAYAFFKEELNGPIIPIVCHSWLLFPPYLEKVFPEGSNLEKFARLFDVIATISSGDVFIDCTSIFLKPYNGSTAGFPRDNTLRRNFIDYIEAGNTFGYGYGVILYDGEKDKIING